MSVLSGKNMLLCKMEKELKALRQIAWVLFLRRKI
nr:MAG TPA: hypothetical protein [Caudoviricetes sp.]